MDPCRWLGFTACQQQSGRQFVQQCCKLQACNTAVVGQLDVCTFTVNSAGSTTICLTSILSPVASPVVQLVFVCNRFPSLLSCEWCDSLSRLPHELLLEVLSSEELVVDSVS